ncbi:MAG: GGDEF domain-containing protein [Acidobacteriota bacterium]|nr:GGDEF domain-containing protein [Acidobacteriota bacterium]
MPKLRIAVALASLVCASAVPLARGDEAVSKKCWEAVSADAKTAIAFAPAALAKLPPNDLVGASELHVCRGYAFEQAGDVNAAVAEYELGVRLGARSGNPTVLAEALAVRGEVRHYRGEFSDAIDDLQRAYALQVKSGSARQQRYALNAIANLYADRRVGAYDRALEYYRQVLASNEKEGNVAEIATAHFNIAATLDTKGDSRAALLEYRRALQIERLRNAPGSVADIQRGLGIALGKVGRNAEALRTLDEALAYYAKTQDLESAAQVRVARATVLRKLGRPQEALRELALARTRFEETSSNRFLEKVYEERALASVALNDWRGAFEARGDQMALREKLSGKLREEHVSRLRVQFESDKKEQENRALLRENKLRAQALADAARIRRLQAIVLTLSALVIGFLIYLVARHLATARRMRDLALTDELTKLPNRRHLLTFADEQVRLARTNGHSLALLALDIDYFKRINDTYGHDAGDIVLRRVADACRGALRQHDRIGRTGGEEFVVVLPDAGAARAREVAERLRTAVEQLNFDDVSPGLRITISIGVSEWSARDDFHALAKRADDGLYRAKELGRNRVELAFA